MILPAELRELVKQLHPQRLVWALQGEAAIVPVEEVIWRLKCSRPRALKLIREAGAVHSINGTRRVVWGDVIAAVRRQPIAEDDHPNKGEESSPEAAAPTSTPSPPPAPEADPTRPRIYARRGGLR